MPRSSARRPAASSGRSRPSFGSQSRSASTMAAPAAAAAPAYRSAPAQPPAAAAPVAGAQPRQPGLFAQMATTAAGVAVGSAVGHTLGAGLTGMFSGSSSEQVDQQQQQQQQMQAQPQYAQEPARGGACEVDARNFTRCLESSNGDYQACDFYLQQLKACQQAARQY
ncbi:hypothetical protein B5S28_g206 [[Candida] boidinii]|uniref:Unnamed protein product n=1 Tax=Candida boidinii TaxID=5477 RepID=A0ACB5TKZ1_CANBO|nr:hypothetical protein B5S28_g206 [[Candida] boidinii]OWB59935.1 hypothetical protein B5S29_g800 [[Candida] boidinii]OWB70541.1 hypothetical protein B5S31_g219 [[Candida] boidinii]OWB80367.1 hypothetical protein B5S32_g4635 [[Candida] boidinii]GME68830.1 unnamed protein product [[Candida] boidinii]